MPRARMASSVAPGKSSPTTATTRTGAKTLAANAEYVADPPTTSVAVTEGSCRSSKAIEPTMRIEEEAFTGSPGAVAS